MTSTSQLLFDTDISSPNYTKLLCNNPEGRAKAIKLADELCRQTSQTLYVTGTSEVPMERGIAVARCMVYPCLIYTATPAQPENYARCFAADAHAKPCRTDQTKENSPHTLPFMTAVGGHVLIHAADTGAIMPGEWTGLCVDARDVSLFWYIGNDSGERSFTRLQANTVEAVTNEIACRNLQQAFNPMLSTQLPDDVVSVGYREMKPFHHAQIFRSPSTGFEGTEDQFVKAGLAYQYSELGKHSRLDHTCSQLHQKKLMAVSAKVHSDDHVQQGDLHSQERKVVQQITLKEFAETATLSPLVNHGRKAEVFYGGQSLGFVDAFGIEGLRQAHKAEVNNALYANTPGAPDFLARPLPSAAALADYPELVALHPEAAALVNADGERFQDRKLIADQTRCYIDAILIAADWTLDRITRNAYKSIPHATGTTPAVLWINDVKGRCLQHSGQMVRYRLSAEYWSEGNNALSTSWGNITDGSSMEQIQQTVTAWLKEVQERIDATYARRLYLNRKNQNAPSTDIQQSQRPSA